MDTRVALHNIVNYFCDILELPEGEPPDRVQGRWGDVFRLAVDQGIYHYLASWILQHWSDAVTEEIRDKLRRDLEWNRARNILLSGEIVELARMFRKAGIQAMFLKGAAGLVRGLYPLECRYLSDIDVMVDEADMDYCHERILSTGYSIKGSRNKKSHHYAPYIHPDRVGAVELHMDPYQFNLLSRQKISELWIHIDPIVFENEKIFTPSISDHVWILMRTDLLARVCLPRLRDSIELSLILDNGHVIDTESLHKRANKSNIPYIMKGLLHTTYKYLSVTCNSELKWNEDSIIKSWEEWSNKYRKKYLLNDDQLYKTEKDIAAIRFYTSQSLKNRVGFFFWLLSYNHRKYFVSILNVCGLYPYASRMKHLMTGRMNNE